jgi:hypothetical protein
MVGPTGRGLRSIKHCHSLDHEETVTLYAFIGKVFLIKWRIMYFVHDFEIIYRAIHCILLNHNNSSQLYIHTVWDQKEYLQIRSA